MLEQIKILRELTLPSILLRIFLSMLFSGILGYEREKKHRPAGFRTYIIVCLGSTLAMMTGLYISALTGSSDPARIPAQAISGIGFLGAGTILVTRQNRVRGLTTAAGLWAVACLGLSLGAGFYTGALIFFTAIWVSIWILRFVDNRLTDHLKAVHLYVEFSNIETQNPVKFKGFSFKCRNTHEINSIFLLPDTIYRLLLRPVFFSKI